MAGMQDDEAHAFPHPPRDALNHFVLDRAVILVAPPDEHVGFLEPGFAEPVLRLLERCRGRRDRVIRVQRRGNGRMHSVRVDRAHHLVDALMDILSPDYCPDRHVTSPCFANAAVVFGIALFAVQAAPFIRSRWRARPFASNRCNSLSCGTMATVSPGFGVTVPSWRTTRGSAAPIST